MSILTALQAKVNAVDSDTSMSEIMKLAYAVKDHPYKSVYDSSGAMPIDSASIGSLRYAENQNAIYALVGITEGWKLLDSDAAKAAGGGGATETIRLGATAGYVMGGSGSSADETTEKFLFASGTAAAGSVVSGLDGHAGGRYLGAGTQSNTHGYHSGGYGPPPSPGTKDAITKFPFATEGAFTDVGNMLAEKAYIQGGGTSSPTHGYIHGGFPQVNTIQKFSTSVDGDATDVGDLTSHVAASYSHGGAQSEDHGYVIGGYDVTGDNLQKYSFASDGNSTPVGNTTIGHTPGPPGGHLSYLGNNAQSTTHGYHVGGNMPTGTQNVIGKFAFASDGDATDVGDLTQTKQEVTNHSATDGYIYVAGGAPPSPTGLNTIERFAYGSDRNAVDCGDLASATRMAGSAHV